MSNIQTITIRRFPENPEISDKICVEINEDEMMAWFLNHFENKLTALEYDLKASYDNALKAKKLYQKKPAKFSFESKEIRALARDSFIKMLSAMKRIAKVRTLP